MSRGGRRQYEKHSGDAYDRFLTERSRGQDGEFSFAKFVELVEALDCPADTIPAYGNNGTKRMTAGILLRSWFADGQIRFRDGSIVTLNLDEEPEST
jgi:hypothetical protein